MQITPTPSSAAVVSVRLCGSEDALVEVRGTVDAAACDRAGLLLGAALDAGAVRLIVDLAAASQVPMTFMDALSSAREELRRRGGWLLVEGAVDDLEPALLVEAFDAYRQALPLPRERGHLAPVR